MIPRLNCDSASPPSAASSRCFIIPVAPGDSRSGVSAAVKEQRLLVFNKRRCPFDGAGAAEGLKIHAVHTTGGHGWRALLLLLGDHRFGRYEQTGHRGGAL